MVGLEALAVRAGQRLPDVLRDDEELLQLREHVPDGRVVVDDERVSSVASAPVTCARAGAATAVGPVRRT